MFAPTAVVSANVRYAATSSTVRLRWHGNAGLLGACVAVRGHQHPWSALSPPIRMTGPGRGPAEACIATENINVVFNKTQDVSIQKSQIMRRNKEQ